jgi:hypothetical protein
MAVVTNELIVALRTRSNRGLADCKLVLVEANGDMELAMSYLERDEARRKEASLDAVAALKRQFEPKTLEQEVDERVGLGFYDVDQICVAIGDLDRSVSVAARRTVVSAAISRKRAEAATWPLQTDCDRLDRAFTMLRQQNVISLQNAGFTLSDGNSCIDEERPTHRSAVGYCFYCYQDTVHALTRGELRVGFGAFDDTEANMIHIGRTVEAALLDAGLQASWSGRTVERISVELQWRRRGPELGGILDPAAGVVGAHFCY